MQQRRYVTPKKNNSNNNNHHHQSDDNNNNNNHHKRHHDSANAVHKKSKNNNPVLINLIEDYANATDGRTARDFFIEASALMQLNNNMQVLSYSKIVFAALQELKDSKVRDLKKFNNFFIEIVDYYVSVLNNTQFDIRAANDISKIAFELALNIDLIDAMNKNDAHIFHVLFGRLIQIHTVGEKNNNINLQFVDTVYKSLQIIITRSSNRLLINEIVYHPGLLNNLLFIFSEIVNKGRCMPYMANFIEDFILMLDAIKSLDYYAVNDRSNYDKKVDLPQSIADCIHNCILFNETNKLFDSSKLLRILHALGEVRHALYILEAIKPSDITQLFQRAMKADFNRMNDQQQALLYRKILLALGGIALVEMCAEGKKDVKLIENFEKIKFIQDAMVEFVQLVARQLDLFSANELLTSFVAITKLVNHPSTNPLLNHVPAELVRDIVKKLFASNDSDISVNTSIIIALGRLIGHANSYLYVHHARADYLQLIAATSILHSIDIACDSKSTTHSKKPAVIAMAVNLLIYLVNHHDIFQQEISHDERLAEKLVSILIKIKNHGLDISTIYRVLREKFSKHDAIWQRLANIVEASHASVTTAIERASILSTTHIQQSLRALPPSNRQDTPQMQPVGNIYSHLAGIISSYQSKKPDHTDVTPDISPQSPPQTVVQLPLPSASSMAESFFLQWYAENTQNTQADTTEIPSMQNK